MDAGGRWPATHDGILPHQCCTCHKIQAVQQPHRSCVAHIVLVLGAPVLVLAVLPLVVLLLAPGLVPPLGPVACGWGGCMGMERQVRKWAAQCCAYPVCGYHCSRSHWMVLLLLAPSGIALQPFHWGVSMLLAQWLAPGGHVACLPTGSSPTVLRAHGRHCRKQASTAWQSLSISTAPAVPPFPVNRHRPGQWLGHAGGWTGSGLLKSQGCSGRRGEQSPCEAYSDPWCLQQRLTAHAFRPRQGSSRGSRAVHSRAAAAMQASAVSAVGPIKKHNSRASQCAPWSSATAPSSPCASGSRAAGAGRMQAGS